MSDKVKNYNDFCRGKQCTHYIHWEYMGNICESCKLVGQSYNIEEYPKQCPFLDEIKLNIENI